jgi:hypothetical protein
MATFDLHNIQSLAAQGSANMTRRAVIEAKNEFNYSLADVLEVIQGLKESDFIKTDVSRQTGKPFDVYCKSIYAEPYGRHVPAYIKVQVSGKLIIISFHSTL